MAKATFPTRSLTDDEVLELSYGRSISPSQTQDLTAALSGGGELIALLENRETLAKPISVFAAAK